MTTNLSPDAPVDEQRWGQPAPHDRVIVTLEALGDAGFVAELVPSVEAGRRRALELLPDGCSVFTSASETLRLSGLDEAINQSGHYDAIRPRVWGMDRATEMAEIRRLSATPDVVIGSVSAVTETGALVAVSASGSQLPAYAGGAGRVIWIVGSQKIVPDLAAALDRIERYALPLENARCEVAYGHPSSINKVLIVNREPFQGRTTVLLVDEAIGF